MDQGSARTDTVRVWLKQGLMHVTQVVEETGHRRGHWFKFGTARQVTATLAWTYQAPTLAAGHAPRNTLKCWFATCSALCL
jgi:hypothetical protein